MITVTRGADIAFSSTFKNSLNAIFSPPSASVRLSYSINGVPSTDTIAMEYSSTDGKWRASWSTKFADPGQIDWFISTGGVVDSADQGSFLLVANSANPLQSA